MSFLPNEASWRGLVSRMPFINNLYNQGPFANDEAAMRAGIEASLRDPQQPPPGRRGPPPASAQALRSLPLIRISQEDLVDPANRTCSICLEIHPLAGHALRLPCAHIFHQACLSHWLEAHCTCPVCRYELPTDDRAFEVGRLERMKARKPRFARHELDRAPLKTLKEFRLSQTYQAVDRQDLIDYLIKSGSIEVVATPEPVEYSLQTLRAMSVSKLRRCMNEEAGVFFDPKDVVEKEDMIRIFLCSGRLGVLPSDEEEELDGYNEDDRKPAAVVTETPPSHDGEEDCKPAAKVRRGPIVETVTGEETDKAELDERTDHTLIMEENVPFHSSPPQSVATASEENSVASRGNAETNPFGHTAAIHSDITTSETAQASSSEAGHFSTNHASMSNASPVFNVNSVELPPVPLVDTGLASPGEASGSPFAASIDAGITGIVAATDDSTSSLLDDVDSRRGRKRPLLKPEGDMALPEGTVDIFESRFDGLNISQLRHLGRTMSIDLSDCIERQEIVRRLSSNESDTQPSSVNEADYLLMQDWSVSDIRTVARLVEIDLSYQASREDMIKAIHNQVRERPHVGRFLHSLAPFVGLSPVQLRAMARDMQVSVSDCLEKDDLLLRIVHANLSPT